uniref:type I protein arginine methyltransferase n=1 Tax=Dermatophagoides pteronyssinus TaxID=6956 RepID=A0A6P6Y7H2_DERPT
CAKKPETLTARFHDYYFNSYSHVSIHEEMLKDKTRTQTYIQAVMENKHLFKDAVVLDVGAGTGILSLLAAKAGARHVYAVEYSNSALLCERIVQHNKLGDRITVVKAKIEDAELPVEKVDILVSEWMGYMLLYENMLESVLFARDKWLKSDGYMFPDKAALYAAGVEDGEYRYNRFSFWDNVYGFDFSPIKQTVLQEVVIDAIDPQSIVSSTFCIGYFDLKTVKNEELDFASRFHLVFTKKQYCHALVVWFNISFPGHLPLVLSTSPSSKVTHWKHAVLYFEDYLPVHVGDQLNCMIAIKRNCINRRNLDIKLKWEFANKSQLQLFYLQ